MTQANNEKENSFNIVNAFASLLGYQEASTKCEASTLVFYTLLTADNQLLGLYDTPDRAEHDKALYQEFDRIQILAILPIQLNRRAFFQLVERLED